MSGGVAIAPAWRGIVLFVIGLLLFAGLDTTIKFLAADHNVPMLVGVRYLANLVLMTVLIVPRYGTAIITRTRRTRLVIVRSACLVLVSLMMGLALQRLPLAEATAIIFVAPMLVVILAGPLLKENIGRAGLPIALLGFAGVLLIVRPGSGLDPAGIAFALCGVVGLIAYQMLSRVLASTETTSALLFYSALVGSMTFGAALPFTWDGWRPDGFEMLLLVSLGVWGGVGHFLFTAAYRYTDASVLAPLNYLQLVWATVLGVLIFGDFPDAISLFGMAMIMAAGVFTALRSRRPPVEQPV